MFQEVKVDRYVGIGLPRIAHFNQSERESACSTSINTSELISTVVSVVEVTQHHIPCLYA